MLAVIRWFRDRGDETLRLQYPQPPADKLYLDLGAYDGAFADLARQRLGCECHLFEPQKKFARACQERFDQDPRVHVHAYGLSDRDRQAEIAKENNAASTYKVKVRTGNASSPSPPTETIELRSAVEFFKSLDENAEVWLMKVNIEGGEYEVLPALISAGLIRRVHFLQIQFHDFVPEASAMREDIRRRLAATHDEQWNYPFVWESWALKANLKPSNSGAIPL